MVCNRCVLAVKQVFEKAGVIPENVFMGEVALLQPLSQIQQQQISNGLWSLGFEILDTKTQRLIEKIKNLLIEKVQQDNIEEHFSLHKFLNQQLNKEYTQLSRLFSEVEGQTIEQFFLLQKIEKVKEWLAYDELTLSEIAWKLGYSSVAHLSAQFKKITGLTPTQFKSISNKNRKSIDQI